MTRFRPSPAFVVACLALLVSLSGVAAGALPTTIADDDGVVSYCYDRTDGDIRVKGAQIGQNRATAAALPSRCPKGWKGFSFDAEPLESPDGRFRISVEDDGIRLIGPQGTLTVNNAGITVDSGAALTLRGAGTARLQGGAAAQVLGSPVMLNGGCQRVARAGDPVATQGNQASQTGTVVAGSNTVLAC